LKRANSIEPAIAGLVIAGFEIQAAEPQVATIARGIGKISEVFEFPGTLMSKPIDQTTNAAHNSPTPAAEQDAVEAIAHAAPVVLPLVGAVLMFLLAFIAVYLA
jgi:hypothetical protein